MKKRLVSLCMALALCLSLLPTTAWAAESGYIPLEDTDSFTEWGGTGDAPTVPYKKLSLRSYDYYLPTGNYRLTTDLSDISLEIAGTVTLDLNGHTLTGKSGGCALWVDGDLTLQDSVGNGKVQDGGSNGDNTIGVSENSVLTLESGTVAVSSSGDCAILFDSNITVTLKGGTVTAAAGSKGAIYFGGSAAKLCADGGTVEGTVLNEKGTITRSVDTVTTATIFTGTVNNQGSIQWGTYKGTVENGCYITNRSSGTIRGGTFYGEVKNNEGFASGGETHWSSTISGGTFYGGITDNGGSVADDQHTVTFVPKNGSANIVTTVVGSTVTPPADPTAPANRSFAGWYTDAGCTNAFDFDNTTITQDTTLYAKWTVVSSGGSSRPTYPISVSAPDNGTVAASAKSAKSGRTVTLTVTPDEGYTLETLTVLDKNGKEVALTDKGDGTYTFTMPGGKVTVEATFQEDNSELPFFVDVPADAYYYDAVLWAAANGITGGVDETHFGPDLSCTRAQIITFLWRAAGSPAPTGGSSFADVPAAAYYAQSVAWAVENGITTGVSAETFCPDQTCTRTQAVAFLYRYAALQGMDAVTLQELVSGYADGASVPGYALPAFQWALAEGVVNGDNGKLLPNDECTRAQIVTMLYRLLG